MFAIAVDEEEALRNSRLTAIRLTGLTLRWMENWRRNVGDYDSAMILLAVVAITAERLVRGDLEPQLKDISRTLPEGALARCSYSSIAAATGLNRETTRRKVQDLVKRGYLVRLDDGSIRFTEGYLQRPETARLVRTQLDSLTRTINDIARDGVLRLAS
jgi:hypothetical protein